MPQPPLDNRNPHVRRIAIFQIISGGLSLVLGIIGVIWYSIYVLQVGSGIWAGLFVITTGIVGYQSAKKNASANSKVTYTAYLVMNIISCVVIGGAIFLTSVTAIQSMYWFDEECWDADQDGRERCRMLRSLARSSWGLNLILAIDLSAVFVASIVGSALSCVCSKHNMNPNVGYTLGPVANQQPGSHVVAPIQYYQQPQQQPAIHQQPMILQQPTFQSQPMILQQPTIQSQPMMLHQPLMQQLPFPQQLPPTTPQQQPQQQPTVHQQPIITQQSMIQPQAIPKAPQQQPQQNQQHQQVLQQPKPHQEHQEDLQQVREEIQQQLMDMEHMNEDLPKRKDPYLPE